VATVDDTRRYARQSAVTDPGERRPALQGLPSADAAGLRELVPGLVIHAGMGELYGVDLSGRAGEAGLRTLRGMLTRMLELSPETLGRPRPPERRLVGNCRASTVLACGLLREAGIPARARCGFSAYFDSPILGDHWVVEYQTGEEPGWRLMDAELDDLLMADNDIAFDPNDVPRDRFVVPGTAWLGIRRGTHDPARFGLDPSVTGAGYVRAQLMRDLAALNMEEVGPWDVWGLGEAERALGASDLELLDEVARATVGASAGDDAPARLWVDYLDLRPPAAFLRDPD
jgi:hypothetical protein